MSKFWIIFILPFALILSQCEVPSSSDDEDDFDAPAVPTGLDIVEEESGDGEIKLVWNKNTEKDLAGYHLYRSPNVDLLSAYELITDTTATQYLDVGLDYDTTYYYRISAYDNDNNESDTSSAIYYSTGNSDPPDPPTGFTVYGYNLTEGSPYIKLSWQSNTETDLSHYNIYKSDDPQIRVQPSCFLDSTKDEYFRDDSIEVGIKYYYKITAVDKEPWEGNASDRKSDLALPKSVLISPEDNENTGSIPTFKWKRVEEATRYKVIVQTDPESGEIWAVIVSQSSDSTVIQQYGTDPQLESGETYYWKVAAYSSDNEKANSYSIIWKFTTQ